MRRLLVLGGGTAGTMLANRLRRRLEPPEWQVTIVDDDERHFYHPGFLFIPFGACAPADVVKAKRDLIHDGVELVLGAVDRVEPDANEVRLADGRHLPYDYLVIATGVQPRPDQTDRRLRWAPLGVPDVGRHDAPDHGRLYEKVEGIISAADFIEKTDGAQLLFI